MFIICQQITPDNAFQATEPAGRLALVFVCSIHGSKNRYDTDQEYLGICYRPSFVGKIEGKNADSLLTDNLGKSFHDARAAATLVASLGIKYLQTLTNREKSIKHLPSLNPDYTGVSVFARPENVEIRSSESLAETLRQRIYNRFANCELILGWRRDFQPEVEVLRLQERRLHRRQE